MPPVLCRAPNFFYPPRSSREILAEERMKEELLEEAVAKLAAEAQAEKNQMKLEEGRQAVHKFDKEYGSDNSDDEKHKDKHESRGTSNRRMTRRRDQNNRMTMGVNAEQVLKLQITASVCGVPSKKSRIEHTAPEPPQKSGGRLKMDAYDRARIEDTPVIEIAPVTDFSTLRPVSLIWPGMLSPVLSNFRLQLQADAQAKFQQQQQQQQLLNEGLGHFHDSGDLYGRRESAEVTGQWNIEARTYQNRYMEQENAKYDSIALIGMLPEPYEPTGILPVNDYYPCMGVLNHLQKKKKKQMRPVNANGDLNATMDGGDALGQSFAVGGRIDEAVEPQEQDEGLFAVDF